MEELHIMNAAGRIKKDDKDFKDLLRSAVTEITIGSLTMDERPGNSGEVFVILPDGTSANSLGIPNQGIVGFGKELSRLANVIHEAGKLFRLNIAPIGIEDAKNLATLACGHGVDTLELNLGCPNVHSEGEHKPIFAYNLELTRSAVTAVKTVWGNAKLAVKLSPYENMGFSLMMAELIKECLSEDDSVVLCNTKPDFSPTNTDGKFLLRAILPDGNIVNAGGMGGTLVKKLSLQNIKIFRSVLPEAIRITGVGGISSGRDMLDFFNTGADAVQVGTAFFNSSAQIFSDILREFVDLTEPT